MNKFIIIIVLLTICTRVIGVRAQNIRAQNANANQHCIMLEKYFSPEEEKKINNLLNLHKKYADSQGVLEVANKTFMFVAWDNQKAMYMSFFDEKDVFFVIERDKKVRKTLFDYSLFDEHSEEFTPEEWKQFKKNFFQNNFLSEKIIQKKIEILKELIKKTEELISAIIKLMKKSETENFYVFYVIEEKDIVKFTVSKNIIYMEGAEEGDASLLYEHRTTTTEKVIRRFLQLVDLKKIIKQEDLSEEIKQTQGYKLLNE